MGNHVRKGEEKIPIRDADVAIHLSAPSPGNCGGIENAREKFRPNKICGHETAAGRMISESTFPPQNFFCTLLFPPFCISIYFRSGGASRLLQKPFSSLSTSSRPHVEWTALWFIRTRGRGSFHLHVHTKKKKGERDKNCVRVYHNHPGEKWPRDPGCCAGELLREGGVPIFLFALSLLRCGG